MPRYSCKAEAIAAAAQIWARACAEADAKTPEQVARDAYTPGGPSVEEIAADVRSQRAEARARQSHTPAA